MKAVPVTNTTSEDFTYRWAGQDHPLKSGQTMVMEYGMAYCIARQLAVRELNKEGMLANRNNVANKVAEYMAEEPAVEDSDRDHFDVKVNEYNSKDEMLEAARQKGIKVDGRMKEETIRQKLDEFDNAPTE